MHSVQFRLIHNVQLWKVVQTKIVQTKTVQTKIVQTKIAVAAQLCLLPAHIAVSCRRRFRHFADCQLLEL